MMNDIDLPSYLKLPLQRALLRNITSNIRCIAVSLDNKRIQLFSTLMVRLLNVMKKLLRRSKLK